MTEASAGGQCSPQRVFRIPMTVGHAAIHRAVSAAVEKHVAGAITQKLPALPPHTVSLLRYSCA